MTVITFCNSGILPEESFMTFGLNAKPNTDSPIGYFGTGLKYAIAVILREGGDIVIKTGDTTYEFYTREKEFRDKQFAQVKVKKTKDGKPPQYKALPFTLELGKNWELWQAFRELASNSRDEANSLVTDVYGDAKYDTRISVTHEGFEEIYDQQDGLIFLGRDEGEVLLQTDNIEIYPNPSKYLYYRGIRVFEMDYPSVFTYNFLGGVRLTEDRTLASAFFAQWEIGRAVVQCTNEYIIDAVITAEENTIENGIDFANFAGSETKTFVDRLAKHKNKLTPYAGSFLRSRIYNPFSADAEAEKLIERIIEYQEEHLTDDDHTLNSLLEDCITFIKENKE